MSSKPKRGKLALYCDGGIIGRRNPSTIGGTWAWCLVNPATDERVAHDSGVVFADPDTLPMIENNLMEYIAAVKAMEDAPAGWVGMLASDSQVTLGRLFRGWALNGLPADWVTRAGRAKSRHYTKGNQLTPLLLNGHPTRKDLEMGMGKRGYPVSIHNVWCDAECNRRAKEVLEGHYGG